MLPPIIPNLLRGFQELPKKRGNPRSDDIGFPQFAAVPVVFLYAKCGDRNVHGHGSEADGKDQLAVKQPERRPGRVGPVVGESGSPVIFAKSAISDSN